MVRCLTLRHHLAYSLVLFSVWTIAWLLFQERRISGVVSSTTNANHALLSFFPADQFQFLDERRSQRNNDSTSTLRKTKVAAFVKDVLCRGCRHAIADPNDEESDRCGVYIELELLKSDTTNNKGNAERVAAAAAVVAQRFPLGCRSCRCPTMNVTTHYSNKCHYYCDNRFWRYDAAAPVIRASNAQETWLPNSLPARHRLPSVSAATTTPSTTTSAATANMNVTAYFMDANHVYPAAEYFMEYNPSIVVLPEGQIRDLQQHFPATANGSHHSYYYLASFRVSNQHYCFHPNDRKLMAGSTAMAKNLKQKGQDYLGLAILNADLKVVADTIVDLKQAGFPAAQDFRLFVLQNQVYISSYDLISPLWLTWTSSSSSGASVDLNTREEFFGAPPVFESTSRSDGTTPRDNKLRVWIRKQPACAPCSRTRGFCGKNFNYFDAITTASDNDDPSSSTKRRARHTTMAEIWPTGPHTVRSIDLDQPCQRGPEPTTMTAHVDNNDSVVPSFATVEELDFPTLGRWESILTRGRGSACCIPMQHENRSLLVGIQHSKTPSQRNKQLPGNLTANHYLSSLYAFDATAPYKSVAQSGWFCLGFPDYNTTVTMTSTDPPFPLVRATSWRRLELGGRIFACPRIHFVSGMTIKADDPSAVIVAYGINDCLSRFVEIRLSDLKGLLFGGPPVTEPSEFDRQQNNIRLSAKRSDN